MYALIFVRCILVAQVAAQSLSVPSNWLNTTSNLTRSGREGLAHGAAQQLVPSITSDGLINGFDEPQITTLYAVLSLQDYYSGNQTWMDTVTSDMLIFTNQFGFYPGPPRDNGDAIYWGLAFYYAYRAYKNSPQGAQFLATAKQIYDMTFASYITPAIAAAGRGADRNVTFSLGPTCAAGPLAGGIFATLDIQNSTNINIVTVGPFMALSAYLYELEPNNQTYRELAGLSLDFMTARFWNDTIVLDSWDPVECSYVNIISSLNSAYYIEGLSVWANVTNNATLTSLLGTVIPSVVNFPEWTLSANGVLFEGAGQDGAFTIHKSQLVRSLAEAHNRNPGTDLAEYIESFVINQFNSLLSASRAPNTDLYAIQWTGGSPNNGTLDPFGNLAAIDLLNAAFSFAVSSPQGSPSTPTGPQASTGGNPSSLPRTLKDRSINTGAAIGIAVGGIAIVSAAVVFFLLRRRRRNTRPTQPFEEESSDQGSPSAYSPQMVVQPFLLSDNREGLTGQNNASTPSPSGYISKLQRMNTIPMDLLHSAQRPTDSVAVLNPSSADIVSQGGASIASDPILESSVTRREPGLSEVPELLGRLNDILQVHSHHMLRSDHQYNTRPPPQYE